MADDVENQKEMKMMIEINEFNDSECVFLCNLHVNKRRLVYLAQRHVPVFSGKSLFK